MPARPSAAPSPEPGVEWSEGAPTDVAAGPVGGSSGERLSQIELRIDLETAQPRMAEIEHLVAFGLAVAAKYRRHAASPGVTVFMEETQPGGA